MSSLNSEIVSSLLRWHECNPPRALPWVGVKNPYHIWISEIMLQQTRATIVIPYYQRFLQSFPNIEALAKAELDDVLASWSGLGYYSRARNLHAAAKQIQLQHKGKFPRDFKEILKLPGIGKSTAGAICSLAFDLPKPILDGNAKRVYSRLFCIGGQTAAKRDKNLWEVAELLTPRADQVSQYTQAIMDLGATVCLPKKPLCTACPLSSSCSALLTGQIDDYPVSFRNSPTESKSVTMILAVDDAGQMLMERRPANGIWGGLWSFPEFTGKPDNLTNWFEQRYSLKISLHEAWPPIMHQFTHFKLNIVPQPARILNDCKTSNASDEIQVMCSDKIRQLGVPAPVLKLVAKLSTDITICSKK